MKNLLKNIWIQILNYFFVVEDSRISMLTGLDSWHEMDKFGHLWYKKIIWNFSTIKYIVKKIFK